jgi:hypothetical protein
VIRFFFSNIFIFFLILSFFIGSYNLTFILMSLILFLEFFFNKDLNTKIISFFLLLYFFIPFLNISTYRGVIEFETILIYCISNIFILYVLRYFSYLKIPEKKIVYIKNNVNIFVLGLIHIFIAYVLLFYLYFKYGNIFVYQELRFYISPIIGYLIKSTIYIPLVFIALKKNTSFLYKFVYLILPLLPAFLIGSRGTVIMIIFGVMIVLLMMQLEKNKIINTINLKYKSFKFKHFLYGFFTSGLILYSIFYIRRISSKVYVSSTELIKRYFDVSIPSVFIFLILPIYFNLRETVGITNQILTQEIKTNSIIPLFFSELFTILPGKQISPGAVLGDLIGRSGDAGLTPGIIGGVYLDFGYFSIIVPSLIVFIVCFCYKQCLIYDRYKILYALSLIQFFHLYHRGFLKLEYFISFFIVLVYIYLSGFFKINNEDSSRSVSISS